MVVSWLKTKMRMEKWEEYCRLGHGRNRSWSCTGNNGKNGFGGVLVLSKCFKSCTGF